MNETSVKGGRWEGMEEAGKNQRGLRVFFTFSAFFEFLKIFILKKNFFLFFPSIFRFGWFTFKLLITGNDDEMKSLMNCIKL